jgi:hypothetical protein
MTTREEDIMIRIAAVEAASRIHQRVYIPGSASSVPAGWVIATATDIERYIRTGE